MVPLGHTDASGGLSASGRDAGATARYRAFGFVSDETTGTLLERSADRFPAREALVDLSGGEPARFTYAESLDEVCRFATFLRRSGVERGDVVQIQAPNSAAVVFACWAAWRIGAVVNPVVDIYHTHELRDIVAQASPDVVVTMAEHRGFAHAAAFDEVLADQGCDLKARVTLGPERVAGWTSWSAAVDNDGADAPRATVDPDAPTLVLFTSGTTARPKGAIHSHRTLIAETIQMANGWSMGWMDRMHMPRPIAHITGVLFALTVPVYRGGTVVLSRMVSMQQAVDEIVDHGITVTAIPPQAIPLLVASYERAGIASVPLRVLASGGTNVPAALVEAAEALGVRPCRIYGMTEMPTVTMPAPADTDRQRLRTDGRIAPGCECEAVDPDSRAPRPTGTEGELRVRGPELMLGYLDRGQTGAQVDGVGWFYTGDLGVVDDEGCVTVTGRIKDIINRGGEKFSARDIEEVILALPGVAEIAVVAAPDRRYGEVPVAFLVPAADPPPSANELVAALRASEVARQKTPVRWHVVDELPKNASGKVKKFELVARLAAAAQDHPPPPAAHRERSQP